MYTLIDVQEKNMKQTLLWVGHPPYYTPRCVCLYVCVGGCVYDCMCVCMTVCAFVYMCECVCV